LQAEALKAGKPEAIVETARKFITIVEQYRARVASPKVAVLNPV